MKRAIDFLNTASKTTVMVLVILLAACSKDEMSIADDTLYVLSKTINGEKVETGVTGIDTEVEIVLIFSHTLNTTKMASALTVSAPGATIDMDIAYSNTNSTITLKSKTRLPYETPITVAVSPGDLGEAGQTLKETFSLVFTTKPFVPANVTLASDRSRIAEGGGVAVITAELSDPVTEAVTVNLAFSGTAANGSDYSVSAASVVIAAGERTATTTITGTQDNLLEGTETIIVTISSVENALELTPQELTISLADDDLDTNGDGEPDKGFIINEVLFDPPNGAAGDANGDGTRSASEDEFIEFINDSDQPVDLSGFTLFDETNLALNEPRHTFPANTIVPPGGVYVLFGGGKALGDFGNAQVAVSTTGNMNLNNAADRIIIKDAKGDIFLTFDTAVEGAGLDFGSDQSITRSPDINGGYTLHKTANAELAYSPGKKTDGNPFAGEINPGLGFIINEVLFDPPNDLPGDANGDGTRSASEDEFIEFVNDSKREMDLSGFTLYDETALDANVPRHIFPPNTVIPPGGVYVLFGGGKPTGSFGGAQVGVSTTGNMNLNNAADKIFIKDTNGNIILTFDTAVDGNGLNFGQDQSITRSPDITGSYMLHTSANPSLLYSPGTKADGTKFQ
ncbi:MAG: lamin tail domain-containing protein [Lewinellaceae bacterium]|nr:lamin tail domain-containing protein [Lewinellaceae bacterium]